MHSAHVRFSQCLELCREHGLTRVEIANRPIDLITRRYLCREGAGPGGARDARNRPALG